MLEIQERFSQELKQQHTPFDKSREYRKLYKIADATELKLYKEKLLFENILLPLEMKQLSSENEKLSGFDTYDIQEAFANVYFKLKKINACKITFEVTNDESVFFKTEIKGINVYFELFFDNDLPNKNELIVIIYRKKDDPLMFGDDIEDVFEKLEIELLKK